MPYSQQHKQRSREKILRSALTLFTRKGYDQVSVNEVMAAAGLTRGAFYAHFSSKGELYAEAVLTATVARDSPAEETVEGSMLADLIAGYLSNRHVESEQGGCPLAFLATDIATRDEAVRAAYTQVYKGFADKIGKQLPAAGEDAAFAFLALLIGGVAVSRAVNEPAIVERILSACRQQAVVMAEFGRKISH